MTRPLLIIIIWLLATIILSICFSLFYIFMIIVPLPIILFDIISSKYYSDYILTSRFNLKRIHTSNGRFYLEISTNDNEVKLYRDRVFYLECIGHTNYSVLDGSINFDEIKIWCKVRVDKTYFIKNNRDSFKSQISGWNGYIDKQCERDDKIKSLGIK